MLIDLRCPRCEEMIQYDDSQTTMFCPYCGCKINGTYQTSTQTQSARATNYQAHQNPINAVPTNTSKTVTRAKSRLSIVAFVFSLTMLLTWLGVLLGIIDAFLSDRKRTKNHALSYAAMSIGATYILFFVFLFAGTGNKNSNHNTTNSSRGKTTVEYTGSFLDGKTLNLDAIESMKPVSSGTKYTIYDSGFNDYIVEAKWWDYDGTMSDPGIYNTETKTLAFSIEVNDDAEGDIYYAYYYSKNKRFGSEDLSNPIYKDTISALEYGDGNAFYNADCSKKIKKGYYLVVVASDSKLNKPYIVAYAEVK